MYKRFVKQNELKMLLHGFCIDFGCLDQAVVTPTLPIEPFVTGVKMPVKMSSRFLVLVNLSRRLLGEGQRSR